jgi:hypothetical protein
MILHDEAAKVWRCVTSWGEEFCAPASVRRGAERAATPSGDVYFRRPQAVTNFSASAEATDLCRRLKAIKRSEKVSSAYWVIETLQWWRLTIYHESAKTVEDTLRALLGWRGRDYVEDKWEEESEEWVRAAGRHAHRVIVPPRQIEALRTAFARPDRTVLIRESGDGDKTPLSLGDAVANVPLWAIKDMLRYREDFSAKIVAFELGLPADRGQAVFDGLVQHGFLEPDDEGFDFYRSSTKGRSLVQAKFARRLARDKAAVLLAQLVERAEAINANPDLAHVIAELRLYGSLLERADGEVGDVDVAFALRDRPGIGSRVAASKARWAASGREAGSFFQELVYGETEVLALLKGRSPYLSVQPLSEIEKLGCPTKVVFTAGAVAPAHVAYAD